MKGALSALASRMLKLCRKAASSGQYLRNKQRSLTRLRGILSANPQTAAQPRDKNALGLHAQAGAGALGVETFMVGQELPVPKHQIPDRLRGVVRMGIDGEKEALRPL